MLLFQEQLLRMAMICANFTGGEAEELRRALNHKHSQQRMLEIETKLRGGMTRNGIALSSPRTRLSNLSLRLRVMAFQKAILPVLLSLPTPAHF